MGPELLAYAAIAATAVGLGLFIFVLFPGRRSVAEPEGELHPTLGRIQQTSFSASLIAAAPRGYVGWLEKQIVFAGRPVGWTVQRIVTWKTLLAIFGAGLGLLFIFGGGPNALKILLVLAGTAMLFFLPDVMINSRAHDRQQAIK
jgi:tight adherence protein C